jgi:Tfp pilus assembly protein PilF
MNFTKFLSLKNSEISRKDSRIIFVGFLFLGFIYYGTSLQNGFNIDDHIAFTQNSNALKGLSDVASIFTKNSFHQGEYSYGYRPITTLSFAIEYEFFGINPFISHLVNILIYFFSCFLIFKLMKTIFPDLKSQTSIAIGFLFLVLPVHTEIANNIKCRDELLMLLFGLSSTLLFLKSLNKNPWLILPAFIFLVCSILSKKTGLVFFGIIPTSIFFHPDYSLKNIIVRSLVALASFPFIRLFRKATKDEENFRVYNLIESPLFDSSIEVDQLSLIIHSFWFYIEKLIFPSKLVSYYGYNTIPYQGIGVSSIAAIIIFIGMVILGFSALKRRTPIAFGAILFLGGMLPIVNWLVPLVGVVAERFVSLASIGWVIFLVFGITFIIRRLNSKKEQMILRVLFTVFLIASFVKIQSRNQEWESRFTLFQADVIKEPNSATLQALVGKEYLAKIQEINNNKEKVRLGIIAIKHLENSIKIVPDNYVLTDLAGLYYRAKADYDLAIKTYNRVIQAMPEYSDPYYNLGWIYLEKKQEDKAIQNFEKAIQLNPSFLDAYEPVVRFFAENGKFNKALELNEFGIKQFPNKGIFVLNKANIYFLMLEKEKALEWYRKAFKFYPNKTDIQQNIKSLSHSN